MSFLYTTRPFSKESKRRAIDELIEATVPDRDFYLLVLGAVAFALLGIFTDSIPVLIASMIVAPLANPILGLGLGVVAGDIWLMARSAGMLLISLVLTLVLAFAGTAFLGHLRVDPTFISFSGHLFIATLVALIAGGIAAYGLIRSKVGGAMTGIGIAVSLMPPLVATGIGIADLDPQLTAQAFILFGLNVAGILATSITVFALFGLRAEYREISASTQI